MPTTTIIGKKGGGKTYYALLKYIMRELVYGVRPVCTTVALDLPELSAYLAFKYPHRNIDVTKRVRLLTRDEGRKFWLHRGPGVDIVDVSDSVYDNGGNPDYTSVAEKGGVVYVLDEVHVDFDARNWAKIGRGLTYYNSQERKLIDDQVFITQHLALVDKRVKDFSQEFVVCRNYRYEKFLTFLSKGSHMEAKHFSAVPNLNAVIEPLPDEKHTFRIDAALARCYDTTQGIGFKGVGKPDTQNKSRRLPWWSIFALVPIVSYALMFAINRIEDLAKGKSLIPGSSKTSATSSLPTLSGFQAVPSALVNQKSSPGVNNLSAQPTPRGGVYVKGIVTRDRRANVYLSDGRTLTEPDGFAARSHWQPDDVVDVRRNGVRTHDGTWYPLLTLAVARPVVQIAPTGQEQTARAAPAAEPGPVSAYVDERAVIAPSESDRVKRALEKRVTLATDTQ